ncbi:MAG: hypothetical protein IKH03_01460 [Oscillospiraceae bacterium]|nr:hypothetical protein [Oscillospiraceae bacterium]
MARTKLEVPFRYSFAQEEQTIQRILTAHGYHQKTIKSGENVWKKGTGFWSGMKFIKAEYSDNKVLLSGWIQVGIGILGGEEQDLTGVIGAYPKKQVMKVLQELKNAL